MYVHTHRYVRIYEKQVTHSKTLIIIIYVCSLNPALPLDWKSCFTCMYYCTYVAGILPPEKSLDAGTDNDQEHSNPSSVKSLSSVESPSSVTSSKSNSSHIFSSLMSKVMCVVCCGSLCVCCVCMCVRTCVCVCVGHSVCFVCMCVHACMCVHVFTQMHA